MDHDELEDDKVFLGEDTEESEEEEEFPEGFHEVDALEPEQDF